MLLFSTRLLRKQFAHDLDSGPPSPVNLISTRASFFGSRLYHPSGVSIFLDKSCLCNLITGTLTMYNAEQPHL